MSQYRNGSHSDRVIHSSILPLPPSCAMNDFPNSSPSVGVVVRVGYHRQLGRIMADIYVESPSLVSPGKGEYIEISEIDNELDTRLRELAIQCEIIRDEMEAQRKRLQLLINSDDKLVSAFDADEMLKQAIANKGMSTINPSTNDGFRSGYNSSSSSNTETPHKPVKASPISAPGVDASFFASLASKAAGDGGNPFAANQEDKEEEEEDSE